MIAARALVCLCGIATGALAADLIVADPWQIIHLARDYGAAEVDRDSLNEPKIVGVMDDVPYEIVFHGCHLGRDCDVLLFRLTFEKEEWQKEPPRARVFNKWNRNKLFGRAYLDDDNRAILEQAVNLTAGVPEANLRDTFDRWSGAMGEFIYLVD